MNEQQVEQVAKWCESVNPADGYHSRFVVDAIHEPNCHWIILGIVAEACRAISVRFTFAYLCEAKMWTSRVGRLVDDCRGDSHDSPAAAAILAVAAYLSANPTTTEK